MNILWNAVDIANDAGGGSKEQVCENTIQISQVNISMGLSVFITSKSVTNAM